MWGLNDSQDSYFYGSVGSIKSNHEIRQYVDVIGEYEQNSPTENLYQSEKKISSSFKQTICPFFIYGSCMFGNNCKNIHSLNDSDENVEDFLLMEEEIAAAKSAECGICLGQIENKSLGMLSNCWCTFCLECIRSWRKEGVTIVKDSVR